MFPFVPFRALEFPKSPVTPERVGSEHFSDDVPLIHWLLCALYSGTGLNVTVRVPPRFLSPCVSTYSRSCSYPLPVHTNEHKYSPSTLCAQAREVIGVLEAVC
jgi:hypothetical protein